MAIYNYYSFVHFRNSCIPRVCTRIEALSAFDNAHSFLVNKHTKMSKILLECKLFNALFNNRDLILYTNCTNADILYMQYRKVQCV